MAQEASFPRAPALLGLCGCGSVLLLEPALPAGTRQTERKESWVRGRGALGSRPVCGPLGPPVGCAAVGELRGLRAAATPSGRSPVLARRFAAAVRVGDLPASSR